MENKFYHGIDDLTNGERYGLKLQLKSVNNKSVFKEYFSFEQGIQGFHIAELVLLKGLVFLINGRIIKKTSDDNGFQLVFEDNTVIRVFPITAYALKKNDFVSIRYLKEVENYSRDESTYEAHKILELRLFNADFRASINISTSWSDSYFYPCSEMNNREKWEDKLSSCRNYHVRGTFKVPRT